MTASRNAKAEPAAGRRAAPALGTFGDRLAGRVAARSSQLVLGLDPDPAHLWPRAIELVRGPGPANRARPTDDGPADAGAGAGESSRVREQAARAVAAHCTLAIEAAGDHCVAVKLQVACFERLGAPGWVALEEVTDTALAHGLLVIADAKRGDIDFSAAAYAQAFLGETPTAFGPVAGLAADALTVNPLLGAETLIPFIDAARAHAAGLFVLVRTSNAGAADVQEQHLAAGGTVSGRLAEIVAELGAAAVGEAGLSDVGAVVGATAPERLEELRAAMPHAVFLLPGVGAQGGRVEDLAAAFAPGPAGALVSASRGIVNAYERAGGDPAEAARHAAARLRELAWSLAR